MLPEDEIRKTLAMSHIRAVLMVLKALPLNHVTLIVNDWRMSYLAPWEIVWRWDLGDHRKWADEVKRSLLGKGKGKVVAADNGFGSLAIRVRKENW